MRIGQDSAYAGGNSLAIPNCQRYEGYARDELAAEGVMRKVSRAENA